MKLACNVAIGNNILPELALNCSRKPVKSILALCKGLSGNYYLILFSSLFKNGAKYEVKNITKVFNRFMNEGKITIQFSSPPHSLYVQADQVLLKSFLSSLKLVLQKKLSDKELRCCSMSVTATPAKEPPKRLMIKSRGDYPSKGFPQTLEILHVNGIQRCSLDKGVLLLVKLKRLDISDNCIESLPAELANLPNLAELNVSYNMLGKSTLKQWSWIGGKLIKTLKLLNLSNNQLTHLPEQLVKLQALVTLHVDHNDLKALPSGIGNLKQLRILNVGNNKISVLPGSARKWRLQQLHLANNSFDPNQQINPAAIFPKPLPICSLKEYAGRRVLQLQFPYTAATLPQTVVDYLDYCKYCVCGNACFQVYIRQPHMLLLTSVAQAFSLSSDGLPYIPIDCYFCSLRCFGSAHYNRGRHPVI